MEILIVFVIVGVLVVVFGGAFGGAALFFKDEKRQAGHEERAVDIAADLFDGSDQVVYAAPDSSGGLKLETLVEHAGQHGYRFVQETGRMATRRVIFERASQG